MSQFRFLILVAALAISVSCASADSLFSIPTAENPPKGEIEFELEQDAAGTSFRNPETLRIGTIQYGVNKRLALGFDAKLNGKTKVEPNIALRLTSTKAPIGVNIGYQNVGVRSFGEQPYLAVSRDQGSFSLHLGLTHDSNGKHGMVGAEQRFGEKFELLGDYIGGPNNFLTLGGQFSPTNNFHIEAGWIIANSHSDRNGLFLSVERDVR